jgi:predicted membrane chloride channel (bestrophin family)
MNHHGMEWTRAMWKHAVLNIRHAKRRSRKCAHVDSAQKRKFAEDWLAFCEAHAGKVTGRAVETR